MELYVQIRSKRIGQFFRAVWIFDPFFGPDGW